MQQELESTLIFKLAETLAGTQAKAEAVTRALALLCEGFSLDCGLIYETDYSNCFCLVERYTATPASLCEYFSPDDFPADARTTAIERGLYYLERTEENTELETHLLDLHGAHTIVLAPVLEKDDCLCGFVLLLSLSGRASLEKQALRMLSVLLPLLTRYVGSQMCQNKLAQNKVAFDNLLDNTGIDIYVNDFDTHEILYVNKSMAAPYGGKQAFEGKKCWEVLFPGQGGTCTFCPRDKLLADGEQALGKVYSWDYQRAFDGLWFRVFSTAFHWKGGRLAHMVSSADITDNKRNEATIERLANFDQLTGLPNRRMLLLECERRINNATSAEHCYLLFFDIDGFKLINDNLGHDAGDEFLIQLGTFFSNTPLLGSAIYRNGGDEFVALLGSETITKSHIQSLATFIHDRFKNPWHLKAGKVYCTASIGVACYPEDGTNAEVLLQKADKAMYQVKKSGGADVCFASPTPI